MKPDSDVTRALGKQLIPQLVANGHDVVGDRARAHSPVRKRHLGPLSDLGALLRPHISLVHRRAGSRGQA
jgi:hypothetical protein